MNKQAAYEMGVKLAMQEAGLISLEKTAGPLGEAGGSLGMAVAGGGLGALAGALGADDSAEGALKGLGIGAGLFGGASLGRRLLAPVGARITRRLVVPSYLPQQDSKDFMRGLLLRLKAINGGRRLSGLVGLGAGGTGGAMLGRKLTE